jgi:integrase
MIDVGRDDDGRRRQTTKGGFRTKSLAEDAAREEINKIKNGTWAPRSKGTVGDFLLNDWMPAMRSTIRPSTWAMYSTNIDAHVMPTIGKIQLQSLTPSRLTRLYADLPDHGRRDGRGGLSPRTRRIVHNIVRRALRDAQRWGLVARNVADLATPPSSRAPEMRTWTPAQLRAFLEHAADDRLYALWHLAGTTGMRRPEVLALRWHDIDLEAARLAVTRTLAVVNYKLQFAEPKTKKAAD